MPRPWCHSFIDTIAIPIPIPTPTPIPSMTGRNKVKKEVEKEDAASSGVIVSRNIIVMPIFFIIGFMILSTAYWIRLMAIQEYGPVIHEFDPYFVSAMAKNIINTEWMKKG